MKTRQGFVSNSSSSSFIIFGKYVEQEAEKKLKDVDDVEFYCSEDGFCVGVGPSTMKDDETLLQFKTRIAKKLTELGIPAEPKDLRFMGGEAYDNY